MAPASEWVDWHGRYDSDRSQALRLEMVRDRIRERLDGAPPGPIRTLSLCAGDGRDLLGVLETHPRATEVVGRLVDLDPELVATGRAAIRRLGLTGLEFVQGDAADARSVSGAAPADLVLLCGIMGNVSDSDVARLIRNSPRLCRHGASVIWTRSRAAPDLTPQIRRWFLDEGFEERSFQPVVGSDGSVGVERWPGPDGGTLWEGPLFAFLARGERPSHRSPHGSA